MNEAQVPDVASDNLAEDILTTTLTTHNGLSLSPKEDRFISLYIKYGDATQAAQEAGYTVRAERKNKELQYTRIGKKLLSRDYIKDEILHRSEAIRTRDIADATEVMIYLL